MPDLATIEAAWPRCPHCGGRCTSGLERMVWTCPECGKDAHTWEALALAQQPSAPGPCTCGCVRTPDEATLV